MTARDASVAPIQQAVAEGQLASMWVTCQVGEMVAAGNLVGDGGGRFHVFSRSAVVEGIWERDQLVPILFPVLLLFCFFFYYLFCFKMPRKPFSKTWHFPVKLYLYFKTNSNKK
jgi:hypothetical protein